MSEDFLPQLSRRLAANTRVSASGAAHGVEVYFLIEIDRNGVPRLLTVDRDLSPVTDIDHRDYSGPVATLLRSIDGIMAESRFDISWDAADSRGIDLSRHPLLIYQLVRCDNILSSVNGGAPVRVSEDPATLILCLDPVDGNPAMLRSSWCLDRPVPPATLDSADDDVVAGDGADMRSTDYYLLSDSFVLCDSVIYPVGPLGDNYRELKFFCSDFPADMAEQYLSVAYSYLDNFSLDFEGRTVEVSRDRVDMLPALVFEKVDSDLALHLRVTTSVRGVDEDFLNRFSLTSTVSLSIPGKAVVRRVRQRDRKADIATVRSMIVSYAPTRKEGRDVYLDGDTFIIPANVAGPFLLRGLPGLISDYILIGTDRLKGYKVVPVKPRFNLKVSSGIDFLEGEATVQVADETINLGKLFEQYRRDKYITLKDGSRAVLDDSYMRRLERLFGDKRGAGKNIRLSYFDLPDVEDMLSAKLDPALFARQREVYEGFNSLSSSSIVLPGMNASLRPYQLEGVKWIRYLYDNNLGGCLADDMGLGKTIQTIAMLSTIYPAESKPALIVMPRSLLFNWQNELERFCPALSVYMYYQGTRDIDEAMKHNVVLTTYAMVRNDIEKFSSREFHYIILDESQNIKNITAQVTRAVYLLNGEHRLALSGTPIENNLSELYSLFRFINPGMLGDYEDFNRRYVAPIQRDGDKDAMASLRRRIFPFMLRRLKRDVLTELPDRIQQTLYVEMDPAQAEYYEQRRRFYKEKVDDAIAAEGVGKSQFVMFQALTELRRIASVPESLTDGEIRSPKLETLIESLADAVANGHKCVVFFNYVAGLELTGERLKQLGIDYEMMTGATTDRRKVVERFDRDPACMVFLMTLKTGGVGLNLTVADTVFIFEPWWNKAAEEQAINRLHRFGQKAKVHSFSLIARDTIEEKILRLQEQKAELFDSLISSDTSTAKHLTEDDINFILGK